MTACRKGGDLAHFERGLALRRVVLERGGLSPLETIFQNSDQSHANSKSSLCLSTLFKNQIKKISKRARVFFSDSVPTEKNNYMDLLKDS